MTHRNRDFCLGHFLLVTEASGNVTVYNQDDGTGEDVFHGTRAEARAFVFNELGEIDPGEPEDEEETQRVAQKKPCKQCPFRRKAPAGWLGASDPEGFVGTMITGREELPCHSTIDYDRPDWHQRWTEKRDPKAKLCAGALTLQANMLKRPRTGPTMEPDKRHVFSTYREFVEHHRASPVQSWTDPPKRSDARAGVDAVRTLIGLEPLREKEKKP